MLHKTHPKPKPNTQRTTSKTEMRIMRQNLTRMVNPEDDAALGTVEEQWAAITSTAVHDHEGGAGGGAGGGHTAAKGEGGGAAGPSKQQQQQQHKAFDGGDDEFDNELDDDELLALQAEDQWVSAVCCRVLFSGGG